MTYSKFFQIFLYFVFNIENLNESSMPWVAKKPYKFFLGRFFNGKFFIHAEYVMNFNLNHVILQKNIQLDFD